MNAFESTISVIKLLKTSYRRAIPVVFSLVRDQMAAIRTIPREIGGNPVKLVANLRKLRVAHTCTVPIRSLV
eukprot:g60285.t1